MINNKEINLNGTGNGEKGDLKETPSIKEALSALECEEPLIDQIEKTLNNKASIGGARNFFKRINPFKGKDQQPETQGQRNLRHALYNLLKKEKEDTTQTKEDTQEILDGVTKQIDNLSSAIYPHNASKRAEMTALLQEIAKHDKNNLSALPKKLEENIKEVTEGANKKSDVKKAVSRRVMAAAFFGGIAVLSIFTAGLILPAIATGVAAAWATKSAVNHQKEYNQKKGKDELGKDKLVKDIKAKAKKIQKEKKKEQEKKVEKSSEKDAKNPSFVSKAWAGTKDFSSKIGEGAKNLAGKSWSVIKDAGKILGEASHKVYTKAREKMPKKEIDLERFRKETENKNKKDAEGSKKHSAQNNKQQQQNSEGIELQAFTKTFHVQSLKNSKINNNNNNRGGR